MTTLVPPASRESKAILFPVSVRVARLGSEITPLRSDASYSASSSPIPPLTRFHQITVITEFCVICILHYYYYYYILLYKSGWMLTDLLAAQSQEGQRQRLNPKP